MNKVHINTSPLFRQVADVIGERSAFIELGKVGVKRPQDFFRNLNEFSWHNTKQGFNFWYSISKKCKPKELQDD